MEESVRREEWEKEEEIDHCNQIFLFLSNFTVAKGLF